MLIKVFNKIDSFHFNADDTAIKWGQQIILANYVEYWIHKMLENEGNQIHKKGTKMYKGSQLIIKLNQK